MSLDFLQLIKKHLRNLLFGTAFVLLGCSGSSPVSPEPNSPIQTNQTAYKINVTHSFLEATILYTYKNLSSGPVYILECGTARPISLEKRIGEQWVFAWGLGGLLCGGFPRIPVLPGESVTGVFEIRAGRPGTNFAPKFVVDDIEGDYRLNWLLLAKQDGRVEDENDLVPLEERISNTFTLIIDD